MSNAHSLTISNVGTGPGPFGNSGTLTLQNANREYEHLSMEDVRMFKEMCGLLEYIAEVDPKFKEYMMAYKAKQRILR
jgi:hypothetical protein